MTCNPIDLLEVRMGKEASTDWGTAVAQTVKLMGVESINFTPMEDSIQIRDRRGSLQPGHASVKQSVSASGDITGFLNYQDAPYLFDGIFGTATAAADTDQYTYSYTGADATCPTVSHWTIAYGEGTNSNIYSMLGSTIQSLNVSGSSASPVKYTVNMIGKTVDTDTFDSDAEADRTVDFVLGSHCALYIDPASDAVGTTPIETTAFSFSLDINTNRTLVHHLGSLTPTKYREARHEGALTLTMELNATTAAYIDSILNATTAVPEKAIRIKASTTGVSGIALYWQVDFNGVTLEAPQMWTDQDGIVSYSITFTGQYNSTLTNWIAAAVQTNLAALP